MTPALRRPLFALTSLIVAMAAALLGGMATAAAESGSPSAGGARVAPGVYLGDSSQLDGGSISTAARRELRSDREPRIIGGSPADIGQFPFTAAITLNPAHFSGNGLQRQFCGGTLVAPTLVITAAHCVFDFNTGTFSNASRYAVITGRTQLSSSAGQEIPVSSYTFFTNSSGTPLFNPVTFEWDAVLLRLASPSSSQPVLLAGPDEAATWERGRDAYVSGWGTTSEGGSKSDNVNAALVGIIGDTTCASPTSYGPEFIPSVQVCAGRMIGGRDTCQGDSGGPLVVPLLGGGFRLVGDTSFGLGCARLFFPGVYGRLAADPMRGALAGAAQAVAGANIVGSGGQPAEQSAPETDFFQAPPSKTKRKKATFGFFSTKDGATFTCQVDKKAPIPCESPVRFKVKKHGKHRLEVTATIFGITEPTPAVDTWKLRGKRNGGGGGGHGGGGGGGGGGGPAPPRP